MTTPIDSVSDPVLKILIGVLIAGAMGLSSAVTMVYLDLRAVTAASIEASAGVRFDLDRLSRQIDQQDEARRQDRIGRMIQNQDRQGPF